MDAAGSARSAAYPRGTPVSIERNASVLLIVDLQERLMPAIHEAEEIADNAAFLAQAAGRLEVPILVTEQNPSGLGRTIAPLLPYAGRPVVKRHFDACREPGLLEELPSGRRTIVAI